MGSAMSNNQVTNYRMASLLMEPDRIKTEPSDRTDASVIRWSQSKVKLKHQTNLLDLMRKPRKSLPTKSKFHINKQTYLEYSQTNLLEMFKQSPRLDDEAPQNWKMTENSIIGAPRESVLSTRQSKMVIRKSLQVQNTLEVVQTSRLEKSINEEGTSQINQYTMVSSLGQGAFGKVKLFTDHKQDYYAIKIANKKKLKKKLLTRSSAFNQLEKEIAIMKKISHPNVVQLYEVIDDPSQDKLYLVMEYMAKGPILSKSFFRKTSSYILDEITQSDETIPHANMPKLLQEQCRHYFRQFIVGLDYLHDVVNVIHRDIKPENLLVSQDDQLKIADFGVSHIMESSKDSMLGNQHGTQAYLAPEVFKGVQFDGKPVDIWAGGVTLYQIVYGKLPFPSTKSMELKQQILDDHPLFPQPIGYSPSIITLLRGLLDKNPETRYTINQIIEDEWITEQGKQPLLIEYVEFVQIDENDIRSALTSLNVQMALKIVVKLLSVVRRARQRLELKRRKKLGIK